MNPPTEPWHEPVSRPIDVHRWSDYPELNRCLSDLVIEIEGAEGRHRRRKEDSAKLFRDAVRAIVLDLYVAWIADPTSTIGVALGKDRFRPSERYRSLFLTYDGFKAAFDGLASLGYADVVQKGYRYEGKGNAKVTRVRGTTKLIELLTGPAKLTLAAVGYRAAPQAPDPIVLRNEHKKRIGYTDTNRTIAMRADVERINSVLADHWLDLEITDEQMSELNARMTSDFRDDIRERPSVDFTAKRLRRIFNNEDWNQGGRFYGGWWQSIPKEYRTHVTIDGKRTTEVDYSDMHPVMMYAHVGAELVGGAYDIGIPNLPRSLIKTAFNRLVNASGRMAPEPNVWDYGVTTEAVRAAIIDRHQPIAHFLGTGEGVYLQNLDADIANRIMLRFADMGYVCLPVHDSFIVHHALESELRDTMNNVSYEQFGRSIDTKVKPGFDIQGSAPADNSIGSLLDPTGPYTGYETRLNNWWQSRDNLSGS